MSTLTLAAAFTAGLGTSVGPCAAPRYLALAAIVAREKGAARWMRVGLFVVGLLSCYVVLAACASLIGVLTVRSESIYLVLAAGFAFFGLWTLAVRRDCAHACTSGRGPMGSSLLAGSALGLVLSPCCTPAVAMMASAGAAVGLSAASMSVVLAFCFGHVAPLAMAGVGLGAGERAAPGWLQRAGSTVSGGLSIALACYYAILA
ncbi:MAG TPA: cytochrome c biogenesis protein CcdA [Candidatus Acidoferrales bacterium]|nr:cytochrome c biogenesis protein CcdA [Candidatus Acidoferrales bacterium]